MWTLRASLAGLMLALVAPACAGRPSQNEADASAAQTGARAAVAEPLRFVDDSSVALAEAKRRGVPVFVEAWAPW